MKEFLFRWRGAVLAPVAVFLVLVARPTSDSLASGLMLALLGEGLRLWALGYAGEPTRKQELEAPALVTAGPYSLVRNPLYLGNVLNALGAAAAAAGGHPPHAGMLLMLGVVLALMAVYGACIEVEEAYLAERFGPEYDEYRRRVPALFPQTFQVSPGHGRFTPASLRLEKSTLLWLALVWGCLVVKSL